MNITKYSRSVRFMGSVAHRHGENVASRAAYSESELAKMETSDCTFGIYGLHSDKQRCKEDVATFNDVRFGKIPVCSVHKNLVMEGSKNE